MKISPQIILSNIQGKRILSLLKHILTSLNRPQNTLSLVNLKEKKSYMLDLHTQCCNSACHSDCMSFLTLNISKDHLPVVPYLAGMRSVLKTKMTRWQGALLRQAASGFELTITRCQQCDLGQVYPFLCGSFFSPFS